MCLDFKVISVIFVVVVLIKKNSSYSTKLFFLVLEVMKVSHSLKILLSL